MTDVILVLNAGSSSVKFSVYGAAAPLTRSARLCEGAVDAIGDAPRFHARDAEGAVLADETLATAATHEDGLETLLGWLRKRYAGRRVIAVGHRVVHGGSRYIAPVRIDDDVVAELTRLIPLAPLHQPHPLAAIASLRKFDPALPQIACFDTAFHHTQSKVATTFALPHALTDDGVRRYGFHGLSYEYIASILPRVLGPDTAEGRVVVAHLGNGASLCALRGRKSVATTMGFTALDGLMMGTRCGAIDPGVILYLLQEKKMTPDAVNDLLYKKSGLLGVSGIGDDMRALLASSDARAAEAVDLFVYRIARELGSLAAALGGLDALIFTAGIGEHAAEIRRRVCVAASWLGIDLDGKANEAGGPCISGSRVSAWVVPTDEDFMIASHTLSLLQSP
ncbi:MAG: acetate/propionate family kinase [Rhizomicrobium sp.]